MTYFFNPLTGQLDAVQPIPVLDSRYVNVTGDTMTGDLNFNKTDSTSIITGDSSTFTSGIGSWVAWYGTMTMTATGGKGVIVGGVSGGGYYIVVSSMLVGRRYTATFTAQRTAGTSGYFALASGASGSTTITTSVASYSITFTPTSNVFGIVMAAGDTIELDDFTLYDTAIGDVVTNGFLRPYGASTGIKGLNATGDMYWGALLTSTTDAAVRGTYGTSGTKLLVYGAGDSTNGLLSVHSSSTNARGTLARFGYYSYWNMDSSGNTYWNWGARYNGTTNAWVRDYVGANNYLPYISYSTVDSIAIGGATSNDKTSLAPTMSTKFNFNVTATDPLFTASGRIFIDGVADQIQLRVQAHSSQTANLTTWENSSGTVLGYVDGTGYTHIGQTGSTTDLKRLKVNLVSTSTSPNLMGSYFRTDITADRSATYGAWNTYNEMRISGSGKTAGVYVGGSVNAVWLLTGGEASVIFGLQNQISVSDGGTASGGVVSSLAKALDNQIGFGSAGKGGSIVTGVGENIEITSAGGGSMTTFKGLNIATPQTAITAGLTLTNFYGIYIDNVTGAGTTNSAITTNAGNIVFNEGGDANTDFRVEGDTDANLLFTDASADKIGIGTNTPSEKIHVIGNYQLSDAASPLKSYRFRTTGAGLDFDGAGNSIYVSVYDNADFTGTQRQYMIFGHLYDYVTCFRNWEWKDGSSNVQAQINPNVGFVFNEGGTNNLDFRVESDTEANMLFVDANADTDGALYLGGTTNGIKINKGGDLTLLGTAKYERHRVLPATLTGNPANQPTEVDFGTASGLQFASTGSKYAFTEFEIPNDWDGTDMYFEIDWMPDSGATTGTDTVEWTIEYRSIAEGETVTNGTSVTLTSTDSADYSQYQTKHARVTLAYNNANQPLTAQDHVYLKITRNTAVTNDFAGTVTVTAFELVYTSKGLSTN